MQYVTQSLLNHNLVYSLKSADTIALLISSFFWQVLLVCSLPATMQHLPLPPLLHLLGLLGLLGSPDPSGQLYSIESPQCMMKLL